MKNQINKEINLLIVDNEEDITITLAEVVSTVGENINTHTARNGLEALNIFITNKIDIIITDFEMPVKNGKWLIKEVRKINSKTPII